jgi:hypothetical protein
MPYDDYRQEERKGKRAKSPPTRKRGKPLLFYAMVIVALLWGLLIIADGGLLIWLARRALQAENTEAERAYTLLGVGIFTVLLGCCTVWGAYLLWRRWAIGRWLVLMPTGILLIRSISAFCCTAFFPTHLAFGAYIYAGVIVVLIFAIAALFVAGSSSDAVNRLLKE